MKDENLEFSEKIREYASKTCLDIGLELVDLTFRRESSGYVLRITVDRESGLSLDDCADLSRNISKWIDSSLPEYNKKFNLEVSSPGARRVLKNKNDFVRFKGKLAKVECKIKDSDGRKNYLGRISEINEDYFVMVDEKESKMFNISFNNIKKANLEIEF